MASLRTLAPWLILIPIGGLIVGMWWLKQAGQHTGDTPTAHVPATSALEQTEALSTRFQKFLENQSDLSYLLPDISKLASENPQLFEVQLLHGQTLVAMRRFDLAYSPISRAAELRPLNLELIKMLATISAHCDKLEESEALFRKALEKCPRSKERAKLYAMLGSVLHQQQQWQEADRIYSLALKDNALMISAHAARADIALQQDKTEDANARIREALIWAQADPSIDTSALWGTQARIAIKQNDLTEAQRILSDEIQGNAHYQVAVIEARVALHAANNRPDLAAQAYESALRHLMTTDPSLEHAVPGYDPRIPQAIHFHQRAAQWWVQAHKPNQANSHLEEAKRLKDEAQF